jgi:hypothetical protein
VRCRGRTRSNHHDTKKKPTLTKETLELDIGVLLMQIRIHANVLMTTDINRSSIPNIVYNLAHAKNLSAQQSDRFRTPSIKPHINLFRLLSNIPAIQPTCHNPPPNRSNPSLQPIPHQPSTRVICNITRYHDNCQI